MSVLELDATLVSEARPSALQNLPPFPPIVARLMKVISDEDFSYREVGDLVRMDAEFSAELLRLANSPVFGFRYEIKGIPHAIAVVGVNRLRGIVMTLAMRDFLLSGSQQDALRKCWRHNFACAMVTELLAEACFIDKGLGYTAGLLHDVGMMALITTQGEEYACLVQAHADPRKLMEAEREHFGVDHCEAGRWLLRNLDLPNEFQQVAARHHETPNRDNLDTPGLVHVGSGTANMAGFAALHEAPPWDPTWPLSWFDEAIRDRFGDRIEELPMDIATRINSFDCDFLN